MSTRLFQFLSPRDEVGATAVEYAIMVSLVAVVVIVAVVALGGRVSSQFDCTGDAVANAQTYPGGPC